jgi:pyrroline-5-carboxylate reductase
MSRTVFIGGGNMARALLRGLGAAAGAGDLVVADPDAAARAAVEALGARAVASGAEALPGATLVVLAVKPQSMRAVLEPLAAALTVLRPLLISVAAGVPRAALGRWSGGHCPVVRAMPNTPALIGAGVTVLHAGPEVGSAERARAEALMATVGSVFWVEEESALDAVTALSGSGPAYFFLFMEALAAAGEALGLDPALATRLALETGLGAARLAAAPAAPDLATLRRQVTSPGGTTERALATFAAGDLAGLVGRAVAAARARAEELGVDLGRDDP